ncbi:unnamed protein product [Polarella glacialis]|uniref:Uncharacterized protein n=1 Tax=Polarella glacialis TaxID=89957 RepID=A0A813DWG2_POLGL|nr:unnamed protein product [Polarella glacialis]
MSPATPMEEAAGNLGKDHQSLELPDATATSSAQEQQHARKRLRDEVCQAPSPAVIGPPEVTVQFRWAVETFRRTDLVEGARVVYRSRGTVDGKGGLKLSYQETTAAWEVSSSSGGCLYRLPGNFASPADFVGSRSWQRSYGGECNLIVMQKVHVEEDSGWLEPGLLAFDRPY